MVWHTQCIYLRTSECKALVCFHLGNLLFHVYLLILYCGIVPVNALHVAKFRCSRTKLVIGFICSTLHHI